MRREVGRRIRTRWSWIPAGARACGGLAGAVAVAAVALAAWAVVPAVAAGALLALALCAGAVGAGIAVRRRRRDAAWAAFEREFWTHVRQRRSDRPSRRSP